MSTIETQEPIERSYGRQEYPDEELTGYDTRGILVTVGPDGFVYKGRVTADKFDSTNFMRSR